MNIDFVCQDSGLSVISNVIVSTSEKIPNNINVVVRGKVKKKNSSLLVAVRGSKSSRA